MIHLFINAMAASAGGGLTYIRNILPRLAARNDVRTTVLLGAALRNEIRESAGITTLLADGSVRGWRRLWYEQCTLPGIVRRSGADILLSTGNFALYRSPIPQILLSRNALYTSRDFIGDLRTRGDYRLWLDTEMKALLARASVRAVDITVTPSAAFAAELKKWTGQDVVCIPHGFDHAAFSNESKTLSPSLETQFAGTAGTLRLLFVSYYNYYRNFETLIRTVAILKKKLHPQTVSLILTCKLSSEANPGNYNAAGAAQLVRQLDLHREVVELGPVSYKSLHHLYRACDLYVTPAYAETFAHPLVEAMASGLPIIASDLAVHREICADAALYFPRFSPEILADRIMHTIQFPERAAVMRTAGLLRSRDFSWDKHVDALLTLAHSLRKT
jgi:glycosyltransferase involved in cell wall biosynthesis